MPRKPSGNDNDIRARVDDQTYEAILAYAKANKCASEASAIRDLLSHALFGFGRNLPALLASNNVKGAVDGTKTIA